MKALYLYVSYLFLPSKLFVRLFFHRCTYSYRIFVLYERNNNLNIFLLVNQFNLTEIKSRRKKTHFSHSIYFIFFKYVCFLSFIFSSFMMSERRVSNKRIWLVLWRQSKNIKIYKHTTFFPLLPPPCVLSLSSHNFWKWKLHGHWVSDAHVTCEEGS